MTGYSVTATPRVKLTTANAIFFTTLVFPILSSSFLHYVIPKLHHPPAFSSITAISNTFTTTSIQSSLSNQRLRHATASISSYMAVSGDEGVGGRRLPKRRFPVVPLMGPLITAPPLMVGGEMTLDPPTPLQWKTLQECVVVHRNNQLKQQQLTKEGEIEKSNSSGEGVIGDEELAEGTTTATIGAAPIIAFIDEATGVSMVKPLYINPSVGGRYATLAAVVGIRPASTTTDKNEMGGKGRMQKEDESEASFLEYMNLSNTNDPNESDKKNNGLIIPLNSSVRLVGIGRAVIQDYFYRIPTLLDNGDDDTSRNIGRNGQEEYDDEDIDDGYDDDTPIVMAEFEPLVDDASIYAANDPMKIGNKGAKSHRMSPVHAMEKLARISHNVEIMHASRRKLVAGLKAAKARLDMRDARNRGEFDDLEDHDGLGSLFTNQLALEKSYADVEEKEEEGMTIDEFLSTFKGNMQRIDRNELPQNQPSESEKVATLENYGLNYYGAFSNIPELTRVAVVSIEPYYSEKFRERDEYEFEVASFVAWRTLEGFARKNDLAWSLQSISSVERLERAYEVMFSHRMQLEKLAEEISDELRDCGEECTDLW